MLFGNCVENSRIVTRFPLPRYKAEKLSWKTYWVPFRDIVWIVIAGISFVYFVVIKGMGRVHRVHTSYAKNKTKLRYVLCTVYCMTMCT